MSRPLDLDPTDTIAAIAGAPGPGLRGLVRLTGPAALATARAGFEPGPADPARPTRFEGRLALPGLRAPLPAALALWPGRRTYTGQPLAEVHLPGAPPLLELALAHYLARGARQAGPGEFTLRAFLAGRIDLTRAEAVAGVVDARNPAQLEAALRQLAGGLAGPIGRLRDRLLDVLAHLEACLDFAEEPDVHGLDRAELAAELAGASAELADLAGRLRDRDRPEVTPRVVLVGPPNAGKSRLFNALAGGAGAALVSPVAGTTRDYLSAPCDCAGVLVELVDTAGLDASGDPIEAAAQSHRAAQAARAELLLDCRPADGEASFAESCGTPSLRVRTRSDLAPGPAGPGVLATSAATGEGLDALLTAIAEALRAAPGEASTVAGTAARCRDSLSGAAGALASASEALAFGGGDELVAIDLHSALDALGRVVGAIVTDDILDRIFRRFCIGK